MLKTSTIADLTNIVAENMKVSPDSVRLWVMVNRQNKTIRPDQPLEDPNLTIEVAYAKHGSRDKGFRLWAEQALTLEDAKPVWPDMKLTNTNDPPILVFLKHFDAEAQSLRGVGHIYVKQQSKVAEICPKILQLMGWTHGPAGLSNGLMNGASSLPTVSLYEEIKSSMIEPMKPKATLQHAEIQDGDIICFQKQLSETQTSSIAQTGGYTDAREFYDYLLNRKQVNFSPKLLTNSDKEVFKLDLSRKMSYEQFSAKVGEHLKVDPTHLRFSTVNATTGKAKAVVRRNASLNLNQTLSPQFGTYGNSNQRDDALYYEILDISLSELDTKKALKVTLVTEGLSKEESFDILVPKSGIVKDLIISLQKKAHLDDEIAQNIRIYEIYNGKVNREYKDEHALTQITEYSTLIAEIIPEEERDAEDIDASILCFHFDKEPAKTHGVPFKLIIKPVSVWIHRAFSARSANQHAGGAFQRHERTTFQTNGS